MSQVVGQSLLRGVSLEPLIDQGRAAINLNCALGSEKFETEIE